MASPAGGAPTGLRATAGAGPAGGPGIPPKHLQPQPSPLSATSSTSSLGGAAGDREPSISLFVPGRVCLFGEHSDWSGGFRRFNSDIPPGATIVTGTNQGLYATAARHASMFRIVSCDNKGETREFTCPMRRQDLLACAREGGYFSYACGVAYKILTAHQVSGIVIENFRTDLPAGKGLSSSAAVCVLVARAFSELYDLHLTVRGEMEFAYQGEILTPSLCGRMDQACAYGSCPVLMHYDGEFMDVEELTINGPPLHYVIVELGGKKSTTEILKGLQAGFPHPQTDVERGVHKLLGEINKSITERACKALVDGNAEELGKLMNEAQAAFFKYATPACPSQLTMPLLQKLLTHEALQPLIWGGKGVGSQGDGTAQLLARSKQDQARIEELIAKVFPTMSTLCVSLHPPPNVRVAVIPAAGFGVHNFPATLPVRAEMFPILGADGQLKPILLQNVESLVAAGVEEVHIIVQADDLHMFESLFKPVARSNASRLSSAAAAYAKKIVEIGKKVHFVIQDRQDGFGHAIYCAKEAVKDRPFLLMLGDHIYSSRSPDGVSCVAQMLSAYSRHRRPLVGLKKTAAHDVSRYGAFTGVFHRNDPGDDGRGGDSGHHQMLDLTQCVEKPTVQHARENLAVPGLPPDEFLTAFGLYVVDPQVFQHLEASIRHNERQGGDFQFTPALGAFAEEGGLHGLILQGECFDIGDPTSYLHTINHFRGDRRPRHASSGDI